MKKLYLCLLLAALILGTACLGFACRRKKPQEESRSESASESGQESTQESTQESIPFYHSDEETYGIATPYGELRYPIKWQERTEVRTEDARVSFFAATSCGPTELFCFHFEEAEGFLLGYLSVDGQEIPVYIESFGFDAEVLGEEDYYNCCAMSEDINVIISHLMEERGLHSERREESEPSESEPPESRPEESEPSESGGGESAQESAQESVPFYHAEGDMFEIDTPFATLKYPLSWQELLALTREEGSPYRISFSAKCGRGQVPLFRLCFGESEGYLLGALPQEGAMLPLYIESFEIDRSGLSDEEYENCCAMCEAVNDTLSFLIQEYGFMLGESGGDADEELLSIETPYAVLRYPAKWKERLSTAVNAEGRYKISFLGKSGAGSEQLFDLFFGAGDGYYLGSILSGNAQVPVYVESYEFDRTGLSQEEFELLCAMQEDVNVILEYLIRDYGLSDVPVPEYDPDDCFTVETKYAVLEYPSRWKDRVRISISEQGGYRVSFCALTEAGELPLFDLLFGAGDAYLLGLLPFGDGEVELHIVSYDVDRAKLSDAEFEAFCAMQEDVNVIISKLSERYGLVF